MCYKNFHKKGTFCVGVGKFKLTGEMRDAAVCSKKADYPVIVFQTNLEPDPRTHFLRGHLALYTHLFNSFSALTASLRYDDALNVDVVESQTISCLMRAFISCIATTHCSSQRRKPTIFNCPGPETPCLSCVCLRDGQVRSWSR